MRRIAPYGRSLINSGRRQSRIRAAEHDCREPPSHAAPRPAFFSFVSHEFFLVERSCAIPNHANVVNRLPILSRLLGRRRWRRRRRR